MTRQEVLDNKSLKEQFVNDNNLPITVLDEPYFTNRLMLFEPIYGSDTLFTQFCDDLKQYRTAELYFSERSKSLDNYSNRVLCQEKSPSVAHIRTCNLSKVLGNADYLDIGYSATFYSEENAGKTFLRVRLRDGAFSVINHLAPDIFEAATFEQFLSDCDKHLRTSQWFQKDILYSICGHVRVRQLIQVYLSLAADGLKKIFKNAPNEYTRSGLLYELPAEGFPFEQFAEALITLPDNLGNCFTFEIFQLHKLKDLGYMEERYDLGPYAVRFIDVDLNFIYQLATYYLNTFSYDDYTVGQYMDLVINYEGRLAELKEPIENPWEERE